MAYTKTIWNELTERNLTNLNNIETQYDEAVIVADDLRKDNSKELRAHVAAIAPAGAIAGQIYLNSGDKILYFYDGANWVPLPGLVSVGGVDKEIYTQTWDSFQTNFSSLKRKIYHGPLVVPGEYTTYYGLSATVNDDGVSGGTTYGQLRKNGAALGALNSVVWPAATTFFTETFNYEIGDTVELWCYRRNTTKPATIHLFHLYSSIQIKAELF